MATPDRALDDAIERLSPRERQVLDRAVLGMTNAEMALDLNVTSHAVKFHLASIYRKLGVANRTQAATRYLELGGLHPIATGEESN